MGKGEGKLSIPEDQEIVSVIALGYGAADPQCLQENPWMKLRSSFRSGTRSLLSAGLPSGSSKYRNQKRTEESKGR